MKTISLDAVLASRPVNSTASRVVSQNGEHYDDSTKFTGLHWENRPKIQPIASLKKGQKEIAADLSGKRFGRFVVIGVVSLSEHPKGNNARLTFVCRCDCGHYEARTGRAIRNPDNADDMCTTCRNQRYLKQRYRKMGKVDSCMQETPNA